LQAHGGDTRGRLNDLSVGLNGEWPFLITRIQPLVTDFKFRVSSQERLLVNDGVYTAFYTGPGGTKKVVRTPDDIRVFYNGEESFDSKVLQSSAMTADAFFLFLLGPLALQDHAGKFVRLSDIREHNSDYYRIYAMLEPGYGQSERDEIIVWIDQKTNLTYRVDITLQGYESTKGAHVDVSFLAFDDFNGFKLPVKFLERVLGPIRIKAHEWYLTGLETNRGFTINDISGKNWSGSAQADAHY